MNSSITPPPVRSPCVKVCELDPANGLCRGCFRTQDERDWWVAYSDSQQREVLQRCEQRRSVLASGAGILAPNMGIVESRRKNSRSEGQTAPNAGGRLNAGGDGGT